MLSVFLLPCLAIGAEAEPIASDNVLLVGFRTGTPEAARQETHRRGRQRQRLHRFDTLDIEVIALGDGETLHEAIAAYQTMPEVAFAQPNYRYTIDAVPNDPSFLPSQWNLHSPTAGIQVTGLWDHVTSATNIIVAVLDTGVAYAHPDLAANMWVNPNPTVGDIHGACWTNGYGQVMDPDPVDTNSHGTHVAGIIGAVGDNGIGVSGVCWGASIMALKFITTVGGETFGSTADAIAGIRYATLHGAKIINASFGGPGNDYALRHAIDKAGEHGILFVAAAGNSNLNLDVTPFCPASLPCDNIIAVANVTGSDTRAGDSCYGANTVHLAAPGAGIYSTVPSGYGSKSGTSMAAPHVAGAAALLWAVKPQMPMAELRQALLDGAVQTPYWSQYVSCGKLSVQGTLDVILPTLPVVPPSAPTPILDFRVTAPGMAEIVADFAPPPGTPRPLY
ncbi:MAG: S8 family serine peptidase [Kiritimatiellaeota bacterium]|nr:S8 family serine peptidase [Kiritimatiellota bacterium]